LFKKTKAVTYINDRRHANVCRYEYLRRSDVLSAVQQQILLKNRSLLLMMKAGETYAVFGEHRIHDGRRQSLVRFVLIHPGSPRERGYQIG